MFEVTLISKCSQGEALLRQVPFLVSVSAFSELASERS